MLLIGYDVEAHWAPDETLQFLEIAEQVHTELNAPCTLFIVGKVLEMNPEAFQKIAKNPLFDLQQHTYSHMRLKPVTVIREGKPKVLDCGTPEQIQEELEKTNELFQKVLGKTAIGLTGPYANLYENGLRDSPELLAVIHQCGIRFLRCFGKPGNNLPLDVQPFWYAEQGYPDMLEFPLQKYGYPDYEKEVLINLDTTARNNYIWCNLQHEWSIAEHDPQMEKIQMLITEARRLGVDVLSYFDCYSAMKNTTSEGIPI